MRTKRVIISAIAAVTILLTAAWAQAQGHIQLKSVAEVEQETLNAAGQKEIQRQPADKVVPGTQVLFTTYYENISKEVAEKTVITNPIPEHMLYSENSAQGAGTRITFSIDGGKTYDTPAKLFVVDSAGRKFPARIQDYTHIRWTFENLLPSGAKGAVSFRAILE